MFADSSAINHVSAGDPPVHLGYTTPRLPFDDSLNMGSGIHHPRFGEILKSKMDSLGIECVLRCTEDFPGRTIAEVEEELYRENVMFLKHHFRL